MGPIDGPFGPIDGPFELDGKIEGDPAGGEGPLLGRLTGIAVVTFTTGATDGEGLTVGTGLTDGIVDGATVAVG